MLGCHVYKDKHPNYSSALRAQIASASTHSIAMNAAQIFIMGPRNWNVNVGADDFEAIRVLTKRESHSPTPLHLYAHATYLDRPWGGNPNVVGMIKKQLQICGEIGARGLVVHLEQKTPAVIAQHLRGLIAGAPNGVILYLEINAAKGENLYSTPEAINALYAEFKKRRLDLARIGLCIDTAHLWSCGTRTVTGEEMRDWLDAIDDNWNFLIHLNDNKNPFGSGKDHHGALAHDQIWKQYHPTNGTEDITDSGLLVILSFAVESGIDIILERKEGLNDDFDLLHDLGYYVE